MVKLVDKVLYYVVKKTLLFHRGFQDFTYIPETGSILSSRNTFDPCDVGMSVLLITIVGLT